MSFWDIFKAGDNSAKKEVKNRLHQKIISLMPDADDIELVKTACISGLLARVAYCDMKIHPGEIESIKTALNEWTKLEKDRIEIISSLAIDEIIDLSGLENHKYCSPLNEIMNNDEKYGLLESLFAIAAGDGNVENKEEEEIRLIANGLLLEHKHYISARATVIDKLSSMRS